MIIQGPILKQGDLIALVSPAKAIEAHFVSHAKQFFEQAGYRVTVGENALKQNGYFSGTDEERAADLQAAIDNPEVKAIVCNRGGYGAVRLFERVDWANLLREPKWIIGFSDITNLHCFALRQGIESVHATMPLNFEENTQEALTSLLHVLKGDNNNYQWPSNERNLLGSIDAPIVGGNLSILYAHLATPFCPDYEGKILFIEDIDEQFYHLDRMLWAFNQAGVFERIAGLIVGGMTGMKDTVNPTGYSVESLFREHLKYRSIPLAFDAPIGHIHDNRAIICGKMACLRVGSDEVSFSQ